MALEAGSVFGGYRVIRTLGEGGMGQVYLVEHPHLGRQEALKVISIGRGDQAFQDRFTREARTAAALHHPSIVTIYHYGIEATAPWFTMEYFDGADLTGAERLSLPDIAQIVARTADALDYAHRHDVVHRDVKPANIMITRDGTSGSIDRVVLLDFGIARLLTGTRLTATAAFVGTVHYAPPEVLEGGIASARSDQYSLACTAFELLTGTTPFRGEHIGALIAAQISKPPLMPSAVHRELAPLDRCFALALQKDPALRYPTCGEFAADLARAAQSVGTASRPDHGVPVSPWAGSQPAPAPSTPAPTPSTPAPSPAAPTSQPEGWTIPVPPATPPGHTGRVSDPAARLGPPDPPTSQLPQSETREDVAENWAPTQARPRQGWVDGPSETPTHVVHTGPPPAVSRSGNRVAWSVLAAGAVLLVVVAVVVFLVVRPGGSRSDDASSNVPGNSTSVGTGLQQTLPCTPPTATPGPASTDPLRIGTLLPVTGSLAFLGPSMIAGTKLAVQDVNTTGGVLGKPAQIVLGDSGDTTTDTANITVDRELAAGTQVIVGAASSAVSLKVIDKIANAGVVMFSPANTSDQFTCYQDKGMYFRTAPPDFLQAQALSDLMSGDGVSSVSILAINDPYGTGLASNTARDLVAAGVASDRIQTIIYDLDARSFTSEVAQVKSFNPDAIVVVGFDESAALLKQLHSAGLGPSDGKKVYGVDGNMGNALGEAVPQGVLAGMKGTTPSTSLSNDFQARLRRIDPALIDFSFANESYDAVIISALAAAKANSTNGRAIAANINAVTNGGDKCATYQQCLSMLSQGKDIGYVGQAGELAFNAAGEPTIGTYAVLEFDNRNRLISPVAQFIKARPS